MNEPIEISAADQQQHDEAIARFEILTVSAEPGTLAGLREPDVREAFFDLVSRLVVCTKPGREWSLVLTKLEEAFAWALRAEPKP
jgi:hypothetical protein